MRQNDNDIRVIAPNFKKRLSGVTATVVRLVPVQAKQIRIRATGPGLPSDVPHIPLWRVAFLSRDRWRVWHARRNNEMVFGLILRDVFRCKLKLLFTSAAQRDHRPFTKKLIAKMDAVVATSPQAASYLHRDAQVIMHGIDTEVFQPAPNRAKLRRDLHLPKGILIGCFGRIRPQKGQDLLVDAAVALLPSRPDVHVVITGRATKEFEAFQAQLEAKLAQNGLSDRVTFLGEIPWTDVVKLYQALDLFVAPARWEGFGLTPIEAMACGTPAVAYSGVGAFDAQIKDGETGRLIHSDGPIELTEALADLIDDPSALENMRSAARAHVMADFTIQREAAALIAVYESLLG